MKVYIAAGCLAGAGALLAAVDYARRGDTLRVETQPGTSNTKPRVDPLPQQPPKAIPSPDKPSAPAVEMHGGGSGSVKRIEGLDPASLPMKIGIDHAWTLHGDAVQFIDGRKPVEFASGHVPGAVNIRAEDIQTGGDTWRTFYTSADPSAWYVVYCEGGDCLESEQIRAFLIQAGFKNVLIFEQGFPGWTNAALPTEKS